MVRQELEHENIAGVQTYPLLFSKSVFHNIGSVQQVMGIKREGGGLPEKKKFRKFIVGRLGIVRYY